MWPFRRHQRSGRDSRHDATGHILSWAERTLNDPVYGTPPGPGPLDSPTDVSDTAAELGDGRSSVQDHGKTNGAQLTTRSQRHVTARVPRRSLVPRSQRSRTPTVPGRSPAPL